VTPRETLSLYPTHDGTLAGALASRASRDPDRPFLFFEDRVWSWGELERAVAGAAAFLAGRGVGHGDRVAAMAASSDATVILFFAVARLGAIHVPVNPDLGVAEASTVFENAEAAAVAVTPGTRAVAEAACQGAWFFDLDTLRDPPDAQAAPPTEAPPGGPDDVCCIVYTSGTTGFPKGAMHVQRSVVMAGEGFVARMHLQPDDRLLCVLPLFHIYAG
jgi:crotonobetaine/carnitine-CoA ligase